MFGQLLENVRRQTPLVHHITNYVTVNDCANITLACGGSPIMADDVLEAEEITAVCQSLVINIGTLNERTISSMLKAGKKANELGRPVIFDPVGAGASKLRTETAFRLIQEVHFSVIRANGSEIKTILQGCGSTKGVDADAKDAVSEINIRSAAASAQKLAKKLDCVVAMTGAIDVVANADTTFLIRNGHPFMSKITGTGCMLSSVTGAFCGANPDQVLDAAAAAVCAMGLCGQLARREGIGTASYRTGILDQMSLLTPHKLEGGMLLERIGK